ncbi:MAG: DNA polymerase beta superfamily protein [Pseudomonadota bacterium]
MGSTFDHLYSQGLLKGAPATLLNNVQYEVVMGSLAYGVADDDSDMDVYGFAMPPKDDLFPHLRGEVAGFDDLAPRFTQFQQHHIIDPTALGGRGREYDITLYSISRYFRLLVENNPNIIDSLFVPRHCVLHCTSVADMVRERRQLFLHKGVWAKFKGYAYGQMHKLRTKVPEGSRREMVEKHGYDLKFAYHVVRLLNEVEQLLLEGDIDLMRHKEQLRAIRRGEWTLAQLEEHFSLKERALEALYLQSALPAQPDMTAIRELLFNCLEQHYGRLDAVAPRPDRASAALRQIRAVLDDLADDH